MMARWIARQFGCLGEAHSLAYGRRASGQNDRKPAASARVGSWSRLMDYLGLCSGWPNAHDDVDAVGHHAGGQGRQAGQLHGIFVDIGQLAGFDVEEVMMRRRIRVVEHPAGIDDDFPDQAFF